MIPSSAVWNGAGAWNLTGSFIGRLEPVPLVGQDVEQDRPVHRLDLLQVGAQGPQVVAVDRADVGEAELLEEHPAVERRLDRVLHLLEPAVGLVADQRDRRAGACGPCGSSRCRSGPSAPCRGSSARPPTRGQIDILLSFRTTRNFFFRPARVVQGLEDDPRGERAVADDGDRVALGMADQVVARLQAQGRRGAQPAWPVMNRS